MNKIEFTRFRALDYACKEAINTLCTNLSFVGKEKHIIMLTSARAHEGKSFLSMNIMRTTAELGKKVVLVDCDLRKSQIAARYGMHVREGAGYGVVHVLAGMCSLDEALYETNLSGACIVPVGREVSNSLALLSSDRLKDMLNVLAERFDIVLVDAPPVGMIIDAAEIAKHCDGTILAVKYNETSRRELQEAKLQIQRTGCEILGVVLNDVDLDAISSKKYYNRSYYNYYSSDYYTPSGHDDEKDQLKTGKKKSNRKSNKKSSKG